MTSRMVDIKLDHDNINIKQRELNQSDSPSSEYRHQILPSVQMKDQDSGRRVNT
jgi:hypothetical protein